MDSTYRLIMKATGFDKADEKTKKLSGSLGTLAKRAGAVAGAYFGGQALLAGLRSSLDLYGRQEQAIKKLNTAMGGNTSGLQAFASQLQKVTRFGDEATLEMMAFLGSIGMTEDQIRKIIPVALDLATATNQSLEFAVRNTAKTFSGMTGELGELVPQIKDLTAEQLKAGDAVDVMAELFGGQAQADAQSYTGTMEQMSNAVGDAGEAIGELLSPAVEKVAGFLKTASENVSDFIRGFTETSLQTTIRELEELGVAGEGLLRLKNLQIDRDIRVVNEELSEMSKGYESIEQITNKSNALTKEASDLALELAGIEENLTDEKRKQLKEDLRASQQTIISGYAGVKAVDGKREAEKKLEDQLGITQKKRLEAIEIELASLPQIAGKLHERNMLEAERVTIQENLNRVVSEGTDGDEGSTTEPIVEELNLLQQLQANWLQTKKNMNSYFNDEVKGRKKVSDLELETTALQAQSAKEGALNVIKAEVSKATASLIASMLRGVPFPLNLIVAGGAGGIVNGLMSNLVAKNLAEGYDGVVSSPTLFRAGEQGAERVQVTNLTKEGGGMDSPTGGSNIIINAEVATDEFFDRVKDYIDNKQSMNLA